MSETPLPDDRDDYRMHSEDPAEGADAEESGQENDEPREHSEDPAEG